MFASSIWMHKTDAVVLAIFVIVLLLMGWLGYSRNQSTADFCVGRRRAGSWLSVLFGFGAGTNRDHGISTVAGSLQQGPQGIFWQLMWLPVIPVFWLIAPLLRRLRTRTTADFFGARFGSPVATLYSAYAIGITVVVVAATLFSGGKLIDAVVGDSLEQVSSVLEWKIPLVRLVPVVTEQQRDSNGDVVPAGRVWSIRSRRVEGYEYAVFGTALVLLCYTLGGMQSVLRAAALQSGLVLLVSAIFIPLIIGSGTGDLPASSVSEKLALLYSPSSGENVSGFYWGILCVTVLLGFIVQPHVVSVCRVGRTEMQARLGLTGGNLLARLVIVGWVGAGLVLLQSSSSSLTHHRSPSELFSTEHAPPQPALLPPQPWQPTAPAASVSRTLATPMPAPSESAVTQAKRLLPARDYGALGLVVVAIMSMMMMVCGGQLVVAGGMFAENLYKRVLNPGRTEQHYLFTARLGTVLILLAALVIQATFSSLITALRLVVMVPAAIGISMWFGLFWRRWNSTSVWVSVLSSLGTWFVTWMYPDSLRNLLPAIMFQETAGSVAMLESWQMFLYVTVGVVSGVIASLCTWPESDHQLDLVFTALRTPVEPDEICPFACVVPEDNRQRESVIELENWQFPRLGRVDIIGFLLSAAVAGLIAGAAVWLS